MEEGDIWEAIKRYGPEGSEYAPKIDQCKGMIDEISYDSVKRLMPNADNEFVRIFTASGRRNRFTANYSWAVPSREAIKAICGFVENDSLLEIAAGSGLWAKLLQGNGLNVIPTDCFYRDGFYFKKSTPKFTTVHCLTHQQAIKRYRTNALMLCWPPYDDPMATECLKAFKGKKLIYIGEGSGGCTGNDTFHSILEKKWKQVGDYSLPVWFGLHDHLSLYVRA